MFVSAAIAAQLFPSGQFAHAETIANAKAQAAAIAARLNYLGGQVSQLSEKYDQAQLTLSQANQRVAKAQIQITQTQEAISSIKSKLAQEAITAYIDGGSLANLSAILNENPTEASVRQEYLNIVTNSQTDLIASYTAAKQSLRQEQTSLKSLQSQAVSAVNQVNSAKSAAQAAVQAEQSQLQSVNATIATLVRQRQQYLAAQAALKAQQQAAARARVISAESGAPSSQRPASRPAPPSAGSSNATPAASASQAAIAVSWARRELGKPYVFGGAGPNVFDCSGLTSYVYAQAGVHLPHSAAAQYSDTRRVSLSDLRPGDLIFYYSPISHVAIYIGGGEVIQALNGSAPVEISGIYWAGTPVGAGRV